MQTVIYENILYNTHLQYKQSHSLSQQIGKQSNDDFLCLYDANISLETHWNSYPYKTEVSVKNPLKWTMHCTFRSSMTSQIMTILLTISLVIVVSSFIILLTCIDIICYH